MSRLAPFQPGRNEEGRYVSEVLSMLTYRPELFAAFVSCQNQCPF